MSADEASIWVLGASTGGIEAVCRFLARVPVHRQVVFIYVQHGVDEQHRVLLRSVTRSGGWPAAGVDYGGRLKGGRVVIPSPGERFDLDDDGTPGIGHEGGWRDPFRPNIDEVAQQVARVYGEAAGLIVFTGMGGDACAGADAIATRGGRVWVQDPDDAVARAMPAAVLERHPDAFCAGVDGLAQCFNEEIRQRSRRSRPLECNHE